jgi:hypothetical protein
MNAFVHFYKSNRIFRFITLLLLSTLIGLLWFLLLYGRYPLYFSNVNWIYNLGGDTFQHQIGWEWFRQEPWHFPLGRIESYGYPYGTTLGFTDSIPLFAIPFKILAPLLSKNFQYLGVWELTSMIGQTFFSMLILGEFSPSLLKRILGASLLVLSPTLIFRAFGHDSLTAQWIILAAIWFVILEYRHRLWRGAWMVLFAVAMLVHLYFVAMIVPLWGVSLFFQYKSKKRKWTIFLDLFFVLAIIIVTGYCLGYFSLKTSILGGSEYGSFSWNLNGFINPLTYSSILNQMPLGLSEQYEGFSYLGLGNLLLFFITFFLYFQKDYSRRQLNLLLPLLLISLLYIFFALSNKAFVNDLVIWNFKLPKFLTTLCGMFRSSGRFIWPVFYLLVLFGVIVVNRNIKFSIPFLILVLIIQLIDVEPLYSRAKTTGFSEYQSAMQAEFWKEAAKTNEHIIILPAAGDVRSVYQPIASYAQKNRMTLNWGYFARADYEAIENDGNQIWTDLQAHKADNQTMYFFWSPEWVASAKTALKSNMVICDVDGFTVVLSAENKLVEMKTYLSPYCTFPNTP